MADKTWSRTAPARLRAPPDGCRVTRRYTLGRSLASAALPELIVETDRIVTPAAVGLTDSEGRRRGNGGNPPPGSGRRAGAAPDGGPSTATARVLPGYCLSVASAASSARPPERMPSMPMLPSWQAYSYITWSVIRSKG